MTAHPTTPSGFKKMFVGVAAAALAVGGVACGVDDETSTDDVETVASDAVAGAETIAGDAVELAARNAMAQLAPQHFADAGHPISGQLICSAEAAGSLETVEVACSGTTEAGGNAELTGTIDQLPDEVVVAVDGEFIGTVDGEHVFETSRVRG